MPIYEYECSFCGQIKEIEHKINDEAPFCDHTVQDNFGSSHYLIGPRLQMKKLISKTSFSLKGKWFKEGY